MSPDVVQVPSDGWPWHVPILTIPFKFVSTFSFDVWQAF